MKKPIAVIDLYCGMGGFTQGAVEAGATVILSCDFWEEAVKVHKINHPGIPCLQLKLGSPSDWKLIKKYIDKYPNHHIHLHGSPPCQALSNASSTDPSKGMPLILHFLDLVEKLKPDSWSMENVVPMRKRLPEGTPSVVLNSADYGVPQTRRRCIAGKGWLANPSHSKEEWVSVIQSLPHLEEELITHLQGYSRTRPVMKKGKHTGVNTPRLPPDGCKTLDQPSYTVCAASMNLYNINTTGGGSSNGRRVNSADSIVTKPSKTIHNNIPSLRLVIPIQRKVGVLKVNGRILQPIWREIDQPVQTITTRKEHIGIQEEGSQEKPVKIRSLTCQETLILQGFNPNFDLSIVKTQKSRWTLIGNAVCPAVAKAIIEGIQ
jgi:site-specific DNA-cytosine methylase